LTAIFILLRAILKEESKGKLLFLSLLFYATWLASIPALNETFYWLNGSFYTWTATLATLCLAMSVQVLREQKRGVFFAVLLGLVFFNGMMVETMTMAQVGVALFFTLYFLWRKQYQSAKRMAFILTAALCALLETFTAPGNFLRQSGAKQVFSAGELLQTLGVAGTFGGFTAVKFFASPIVWSLLLYMPVIAKAMPPFDAKATALLHAKHIFFLTILAAIGNQAIHAFSVGTPLSPRGEGLAMWMMTAVWLFLWAFVYRNTNLFAKIEKLKIYHWRNGILIFCLILSPNFISLVRDMRIAPLYAQEMKERYASTERQKREGKREFFLPSLRHIPKSIFCQDLTLFPENPLNNSGYSDYWAVDATICYPYALTSNGDAEFTSLKEVVEKLQFAAGDGDPEVIFKLGEVYDTIFPNMGDAVKDNTLAVQYYLQAARQGYAPAQSRLIRVYAMGAGVPRDYFCALGWLLRFSLP
jgi:hypothetical protein